MMINHHILQKKTSQINGSEQKRTNFKINLKRYL